MGKAPAFQFYPADFLSDENVALMTNQEVGCYIKLMCYCWRQKSIPKDLEKISKLCGESLENMTELWPQIEPCFNVNGSRYFHKRLDVERKKQSEWRKKSSKGGKHSASNKAGLLKGGSSGDSKGGSTLQSSSSSSPSISIKKVKYKECVFLTPAEHEKLSKAHGPERLNSMIEILNNYKMQNGKKYKSDYHAILNWVAEKVKLKGDKDGIKGSSDPGIKEFLKGYTGSAG